VYQAWNKIFFNGSLGQWTPFLFSKGFGSALRVLDLDRWFSKERKKKLTDIGFWFGFSFGCRISKNLLLWFFWILD